MLYNTEPRHNVKNQVVNCFQFCNNFDVVQLNPGEPPEEKCCELLSIL